MQKAVGYVRVSSDQQVADGVSLEAQAERIRAYCLLNDFQLTEIYVDAGISGKRADNRPELQKALDDSCQSKAVLVVYSLSRLARSTKDTIEIAERLDKAGADLASLSERIDTSSAAGKMVFRMLAVLAEHERDLVSERTKLALSHKKAKLERTGTVPYGYDLAFDGVTLVPNQMEQKTITEIQELRRSGQSLERIAAYLTQQNRPTKAGNSEWGYTSVRSILKRCGV